MTSPFSQILVFAVYNNGIEFKNVHFETHFQKLLFLGPKMSRKKTKRIIEYIFCWKQCYLSAPYMVWQLIKNKLKPKCRTSNRRNFPMSVISFFKILLNTFPLKIVLARYHFFRTDTDPILKILSIYRYRSDTSTVFLNQCRFSISQCVLTCSSLFCVLHTIY